MRPRIQGGGQEPSTSGREFSQPSQPKNRHSRARPLRPRHQHVESCSIAIGLPPHVPTHRGSLRAAFEQLDSPMQARRRLERLSSLLLVPSLQARDLVLSSPELLTLKSRLMEMRVQHLAAFVASCPPPLKSRRHNDQETEDSSYLEPEPALRHSTLLIGWPWPGKTETQDRLNGTCHSNPNTLSSSMLFGFTPQELDTVDPTPSPDDPPPGHPSLLSEGQVLLEVSSLIHREPRLLTSPADACNVVQVCFLFVAHCIHMITLLYPDSTLPCFPGSHGGHRARHQVSIVSHL